MKSAAKIDFELDFRRLKIQFVELDFYNFIFQKSSTDQQGVYQMGIDSVLSKF